MCGWVTCKRRSDLLEPRANLHIRINWRDAPAQCALILGKQMAVIKRMWALYSLSWQSIAHCVIS